jgi:hypothetical protein
MTTYTMTSQDRCSCSALRYMHHTCFYIAHTSDNQRSNELMEEFIYFTIWATTTAKTFKETFNISSILQAQRSFETELSKQSRSAPPTVKINSTKQIMKLRNSTDIAYLKANFLNITTAWVEQHSVTLSNIECLPHEDDIQLGMIARNWVLSQKTTTKNRTAEESRKPDSSITSRGTKHDKEWAWINNLQSRPAPTSTSPQHQRQ